MADISIARKLLDSISVFQSLLLGSIRSLTNFSSEVSLGGEKILKL